VKVFSALNDFAGDATADVDEFEKEVSLMVCFWCLDII